LYTITDIVVSVVSSIFKIYFGIDGNDRRILDWCECTTFHPILKEISVKLFISGSVLLCFYRTRKMAWDLVEAFGGSRNS
jgi:hypothetical protein